MNASTRLIAAGLLCIGLGDLTGCASRKDRAEAEVEATAESFYNRLQKLPGQIDQVVSDLQAVSRGQNANRAEDFSRFQRSVAEMESSARAVGAKYQEALADSNRFYREWAKEARSLSASERQTLESQVGTRLQGRADAISYFEQARTNLLKFASNLSQLSGNLAGNLSEQNVRAQDTLTQRALDDSLDTRNYIDRLDEVLRAAIDLN